jgi:hypothetical protein
VDYGRFVNQLKQVVEPLLMAYEFRDEILRKVAEQHADVADPRARWDNTKIAILGASDPRDEADDITATIELPDIHAVDTRLSRSDILEQENRLLGVHREFAKVLSDLLRAKGYQGRKGARVPSQYMAWQDPRKNPLKENARSEAWAKQLAALDCVIVLRDHPDYDVDFIRQHARCVVDARQHGFDPIQGQTAKQLQKPIAVTYTGMVPVLYRAQQSLLQNFLDSGWWAFVAIAVVMMIAVVIPALFTVVVVFGELSRRGLTVDIGTLMTVGVAMGATVVGTFQFLIWFQRSVRAGLERRAAIKAAFRRASLPILQTTLVACAGLALFVLGTFVPTQRFGLTMLAMLLASLVANLFVLPALLAGPLGRYLAPRMPEATSADGRVPNARDPETALPLELLDALPAGSLHTLPREGRPATRMRRDGSHR